MSNNMKMTKALGMLRDNRVRNYDKFNVLNSTNPVKVSILNWQILKRRLGFDDYTIPYVVMYIAGFVLIFQAASFYLIFGEKPVFSNHGFYKSYHAGLFFYPAKTNPDIHYTSATGFYTGDRLYGLRALPKRPWEAFKDPENTMKRVAYKHNRDNPNF